MAEDLKKGGKGEIDLSAADKLVAAAAEVERCNIRYFLGQYLAQHGKADQAVQYWKKCMACTSLTQFSRTLAGAELLDRGVKPEDYKALLQAPASDDPKPK